MRTYKKDRDISSILICTGQANTIILPKLPYESIPHFFFHPCASVKSVVKNLSLLEMKLSAQKTPGC
jgi:hypothetical protein